MFLRKNGFPEEDSLVLCTITNIHFHSVFAKMDEYDKTGLIHISEIAPGRIRNIRDFVAEGKKVVCKVLRIDNQKGHIDLSLRRVNENQRKKKINEIKQEQKAEKIIEQLAKQQKILPEKLYGELTEKIFKKYEDLTSCFKDVVDNPKLLSTLGVDKKWESSLVEVIKVRFKPEELIITGTLKLKSYEPNGVEVVKEYIQKALKTDKSISITYLGGGNYLVEVTALKYKDAELVLEKALQEVLAIEKDGKGKGEFVRKP